MWLTIMKKETTIDITTIAIGSQDDSVVLCPVNPHLPGSPIVKSLHIERIQRRNIVTIAFVYDWGIEDDEKALATATYLNDSLQDLGYGVQMIEQTDLHVLFSLKFDGRFTIFATSFVVALIRKLFLCDHLPFVRHYSMVTKTVCEDDPRRLYGERLLRKALSAQ